MAFQPIVDLGTLAVYGYEALVRGISGGEASSILEQVTPRSLYRFDQACRIRALELAHGLGGTSMLSINFLPNAVYDAHACIRATLAASLALGWPASRIIFEINETEYVRDRSHLQCLVDTYRSMGFTTAIDDFGAGYANLELLTDLRPDMLKLDRGLIIDIDQHARRQSIVDALITIGKQLDMLLVAEGVETLAEARWLYQRGIVLQQGYFYARPQIEHLPGVTAGRFAAATNSVGAANP
ncbi:MAG: EAL domain-containing protein [Salinisphaera sp.]|nr:EAL domain-containing protein [Salinisphaera sp.]